MRKVKSAKEKLHLPYFFSPIFEKQFVSFCSNFYKTNTFTGKFISLKPQLKVNYSIRFLI